jgi:hypothetical protein
MFDRSNSYFYLLRCGNFLWWREIDPENPHRLPEISQD